MIKPSFLIAFFSLAKATIVYGIEINCLSIAGKKAQVKISSPLIDHAHKPYTGKATVTFSKMSDKDLNGKAFQAVFIRSEGNGGRPVVMAKLSEYEDETDTLQIVFKDDELTKAELHYHNVNSEITIALSKLSCTKTKASSSE